MTLKEKFDTAEIFIGYAKQLSGYDFDDVAMSAWYENNHDFFLTYTGIVKECKGFVTGVVIPAKQNV